MKHVDLFSGIGSFSLAVDTVWNDENNTHTFVEKNKFCQAVLKKHWPDATIHRDISAFIADTTLKKQHLMAVERKSNKETTFPLSDCDLLTGGFPCQPFSQAGRREGMCDDRYLWPDMLESITILKPQWIIAENVSGLVSWNEGLVLETVCSDLEKENYEVCPFLIPACAVNAPHRRERVWIIANRNTGHGQKTKVSTRRDIASNKDSHTQNTLGKRSRWGRKDRRQVLERQSTKIKVTGSNSKSRNDTNTTIKRLEGRLQPELSPEYGGREIKGWNKDWPEIAAELCRVDDGVSARMDGLEITKAQHRKERLKSLGNAIVPQVAIEILKNIKKTCNLRNTK